MKNIFLAPRSNETSYKNFESTITGGRPYSFFEPYLNDVEKVVLSKYKEISVWGNKESLKNRWAKMQPGDCVLFYAKGFFYFSARVVLLKYSQELGEKLWPLDEDGEPWPCLFFVDDLKEIKIPIKTLRDLGGYQSTWDRVQGFMRFKDKGLRALVAKFGSVEAFLKQTPEVYELIDGLLEDMKEETVEGEEEEIDKVSVLREAVSYRDSGVSYIMDTVPRKRRVESRSQKRKIADLEDRSCQICNWSLEWVNSRGRKSFRIDVDHIVDKANGGGEESSNLWVLCPNCHVKKTLGVIVIDPKKHLIFEGGKEIKLHHDNHLGW